jgi:hypothetical protein
MRWWCLLLAVMIGLIPVAAGAEFYKYRDDSGVLRFTDNLFDVPEDQRPQVTRYQEPADTSAAAPRRSAPERQTRKSPPASTGVDSPKAPIDLSAPTAEALEKLKKRLELERADLAAERRALEERRQSLSKPEEVQEFNRQAEALNTRIERYEADRQRLKAGIETFQRRRGSP